MLTNAAEVEMSLVGRVGKALGTIIGLWLFCAALSALILWNNENNFGPVLFFLGAAALGTLRAIYRIFSGHGRERDGREQGAVGDPIPMFWYLGRAAEASDGIGSGPVWCAAVVAPPVVRVYAAEKDLATGHSDDPWADLGKPLDAWPIMAMEQIHLLPTDDATARKREQDAKRKDALFNWTVGKALHRSTTTLVLEVIVAVTVRNADGSRLHVVFGVPQQLPPGVSASSLLGVVLPENWIRHTWEGVEVVSELAEGVEAFAEPTHAASPAMPAVPRFAPTAAAKAVHMLLARVAPYRRANTEPALPGPLPTRGAAGSGRM